ncbi:MAG: HNH endonuclease [Acidimicrobiales bacterium]|nr:HNH endonuclease [Acidimicrobiales bacterium]
MTRVLVLNATFEPLSVVSSRRAICLVLAEKAEMVVGTGRAVRSEKLSLDEPSVVRLSRFVQVPYNRRRSLNRRAVFARDNNRCQYCGATAESLDHVIPSSRGGSNTWENVVAACRPCNTRKRDRMLSETSMRLRTVPRAPHPSTWFRLAVGSLPEPWEQFIATNSELAS